MIAASTSGERVVIASEQAKVLARCWLEAADDGADAGQSAARGAAGWIGGRIDASQRMAAEDNEGVPVAEQVTAVGNEVVDGLQWAGDQVAEGVHEQIDATQDELRVVAQAAGAVMDRAQEAVDKIADIDADIGEVVRHEARQAGEAMGAAWDDAVAALGEALDELP